MGLTEKIQSLTTKANQKTGQQDSTLSEAVDTLIDGYDRIPEGYVKPTGTLDIGTDGEHNVTNYEKVNVLTNLQSVTVNPSEHWNVIMPEQSSNAIDGFSEIYVNPIPSEYVKPTGTLNIGAGGEYDVTNYKNVNVHTDLTPITVTAEQGSSPTIYFPGDSDTTIMGYSYVVVNPIPSEYIKPTGTLDVGEKGVHDVTEYANVNVRVELENLDITPSTEEQQFYPDMHSDPIITGFYGVKVKPIPSEYVIPTGTKNINITENGTITENVTNYANAQITTNVVNQDYEDAKIAFGVTEDLANSIEALTTYTNEVTGENDTTLSDAVRTLTDGYGGGGIIPLTQIEYNNLETKETDTLYIIVEG